MIAARFSCMLHLLMRLACLAFTVNAAREWWKVAAYLPHLTEAHGRYLFHPRQFRIWRRHPQLGPIIKKAVRLAKRECGHNFKHRRWNCLPRSRGFGLITNIGCPETAFIYAVTSAAFAHVIAKECSSGSLTSCSCDPSLRGPSGQGFLWNGCSDNVRFALRITRKFTDINKSTHIRELMDEHNNKAGRMHLRASLHKVCKCHGASGSCTSQTCWLSLRRFRVTGTVLMRRFYSATKIRHSNRVMRRRDTKRASNILRFVMPGFKGLKPPGRKDLVYYEDSPDYCRNKNYAALNKGRECNESSQSIDRCSILCCRSWKRTIQLDDVPCGTCQLIHFPRHVTCPVCPIEVIKGRCL